MRTTSICGLLLSFLALTVLSGCGTYVPQIAEVWERNDLSTKTLERKIKEQVFCELESAIRRIDVIEKRNFIKVDGKLFPPVPENWGVIISITLTILEDSSLTPTESLMTAYKPLSLGFGATLSTDATRTDKLTFFYPIKDLEDDTGECDFATAKKPNGRTFDDLHGSSFLLESDLGIYTWIENAVNVRAGIGVPSKYKQELMSYDVKFEVVTSANITPTIKLVRSVTNGSGTFFSTKRDRTHELSLVFGPVDTSASDQKKKKLPPQPSLLAINESLALQIGSAVAASIKTIGIP